MADLSVQSSLEHGGPALSINYGAAPALKLGDRVVLADGRIGHLRYLGQVMFSSGTWAGIELDQDIGKNDGSVHGVRYFTCKDRHGLFVQPEKLTPIFTPKIASRNLAAAPAAEPNNPFEASTPVPPFRITETTDRLMKEFSNPVREAPKTPVKNILDMSSMIAEGTPGTSALSRELFKRQEEVNMIRRHVEPLLRSAKRMVAGTHTDPQVVEHLSSVVTKLSGSMQEYDKVVARYERQLQKLIQHMDRRRAQNLSSLDEAEKDAQVRLEIRQKELDDAALQLSSLESQYRLLKKEYEQVQRNLASRVSLGEELEAENAELKAKLERAGKDTSAAEQIEALTAALEATKKENQSLRREIELTKSLVATSASSDQAEVQHHYKHRLSEVLQAKDNQEAYFKECIEALKKDHQEAMGLAKKQLDTAEAEAKDLRWQLEAQQSRADQYHRAIEQTSDRFFEEKQAKQEESAQLRTELDETRRKLNETVQVIEQLSKEKQERQHDLDQMSSKVVELSSAMARERHQAVVAADDQRLREALKQIEAMEQTIVSLNEALQKGPSGEADRLRRQLAQTEFEKAELEKSLAHHRSRQPAPPRSEHPRAAEIKKELASLRPALPTLVERLGNLMGFLKVSTSRNVPTEGVQEGYAEVKRSLQDLEASHQRALHTATRMLSAAADGTPTMNRHRPGPPVGMPSKLSF